jgi:hypothetical protein
MTANGWGMHILDLLKICLKINKIAPQRPFPFMKLCVLTFVSFVFPVFPELCLIRRQALAQPFSEAHTFG